MATVYDGYDQYTTNKTKRQYAYNTTMLQHTERLQQRTFDLKVIAVSTGQCELFVVHLSQFPASGSAYPAKNINVCIENFNPNNILMKQYQAVKFA